MASFDPETWKALLKRRGLSASKGLGQHFLVSPQAIGKILEASAEAAGVLEIGPGPGVLTSGLADGTRRVLAIEVDPRMAEVLAETSPNAEVLIADALQTDWGALLQDLPRPRAIVSNLPYYITSAILRHIFEHLPRPQRVVVTVQREVAERLIAGP
ncbi:MAG: rRNA adenine dimethyltransferase family protein, partial [Fimbriimonadales bacterium]